MQHDDRHATTPLQPSKVLLSPSIPESTATSCATLRDQRCPLSNALSPGVHQPCGAMSSDGPATLADGTLADVAAHSGHQQSIVSLQHNQTIGSAMSVRTVRMHFLLPVLLEHAARMGGHHPRIVLPRHARSDTSRNVLSDIHWSRAA